VVFLPTGKELLSASYDRTIRQWNIETGTLIRTLKDVDARLGELSISADGRLLLAGGEGGFLKVWNLETGKVLWHLPGHREWVTFTAPLPGDKMAISGDAEGIYKVWDLKSGKCTASWEAGSGRARGPTVLPPSPTLPVLPFPAMMSAEKK
jgi:WD40 repeat protein